MGSKALTSYSQQTSPTRKTSWRTMAERFWAPPVAQKIPLCHLYFKWHLNSRPGFISVKVSNDCNFHSQWKQSSAVGFIFQSFRPPLFTLPSCRCWGYCCAYFVRCCYYLWPCLVSRLWKTPDKTSVSATTSAGSLLHSPLNRFVCERQGGHAAPATPGVQQRPPGLSGVTSLGAGFQGTPWDGGEDLAELRAKLSGY